MAFWSRPQRPPFPTEHDAEAREQAAQATLTAALDRLDELDPGGALQPAPPIILTTARDRKSERVVPWRQRMRDGPQPEHGLETGGGEPHVADHG